MPNNWDWGIKQNSSKGLNNNFISPKGKVDNSVKMWRDFSSSFHWGYFFLSPRAFPHNDLCEKKKAQWHCLQKSSAASKVSHRFCFKARKHALNHTSACDLQKASPSCKYNPIFYSQTEIQTVPNFIWLDL